MTLCSVMSYQDRGKWGNPRYQGNCSGWVIYDLLQHFKPKSFTEVFAGGGTGYEVARELGYQDSVHLDLNPAWGGWNALKDEMPIGSDFVFSHPAYHNIIEYSGNMWGQAHKDDLSRCIDYNDFLKKLNLVNEKMMWSLKRGGRMAILIGDVRKNGDYFPIFADMQRYGKLESIIIKEQFNCNSDRRMYNGKLIRIMHEYVMIFRKNNSYIIPFSFMIHLDSDIRRSKEATWRDLTQACLEKLGGKADLESIYKEMESFERAKGYPTLKEKVRQTLQIHPKCFVPIQRGVWGLAS